MNNVPEWRDIPGYEGLYQISNQGEVRSFRFAKVGRPLHPYQQPNGYVSVTLYKDGVKHRPLGVHTLVMLAFVGDRPARYVVNHNNGVQTDNRLENLEYVTQSENAKHAYEVLGREKRKGQAHSQAKLTDEQVLEVRRLINETPMYAREIAELFGVSRGTIDSIKHGKSWSHL